MTPTADLIAQGFAFGIVVLVWVWGFSAAFRWLVRFLGW